MPVIAVVVVAVLALKRRSWLPVLLMGIAAAGSVLVTVLGKDLTGRARPPVALAVPPFETSPSFPSGHTLNATVVLGVSAYLVMLGRRHLRSRLLVGLGGRRVRRWRWGCPGSGSGTTGSPTSSPAGWWGWPGSAPS